MIVALLRAAYAIVSLIVPKYGKRPWPTHHEDPLHMRTSERIYLGYKYYYQLFLLPEAGAVTDNLSGIDTVKFIVPDKMIIDHQLTLASGGDLMPYAPIRMNVCTDLWEECGPWFFNADIITANLETPIVGDRAPSYVPEVMLSDMYFNGNSEMFEIFSGNGEFRGYDLLSIANNHSFDQGEAGLLATMNFLDAKHIKFAGAARSAEEIMPTFIEKNGIKIAFIAATFSLNAEKLPEGKEYLVNLVDLNDPDPDISLLISQAHSARKAGADFIVFMLHMGCAYQAYPAETVRKNTHKLLRMTSADIVLGNHAHHPQPIEKLRIFDQESSSHKDALIIYAHGDFIAYDIYKWCHLPLLAKISLCKGSLNGKPYTCITDVRFKLYYMYAEIKNGTVESLKLLDYEKIKENIPEYFDQSTKAELKEIESLVDIIKPEK